VTAGAPSLSIRRHLESTNEPAVWLGAVVVLAAAFYGFLIWSTAFGVHGQLYFTLIDDAMISMRYARHLAQGYGLVWNVGAPPVQGFTNPAWMLLMAVPHWLHLPLSRTSLLVMSVSAAILLALIVMVYRISWALAPRGSRAPLMAATITAFYFPLVFWSVRGMEVGLLALLIAGAVLVAVSLGPETRASQFVVMGLLLALAIATRLDATAQVVVVLVYYVLSHHQVKGGRRFIPAVLAAAALVGILAWQRAYFGDPLPNTYYQKLVGTPAWTRVKNGLLVFYQYAMRDALLPVLLSAVAILRYKDLRTRETALLAALFLVECAYSIWVGGDYAEPEVDAANRFITQGMPPLIILFSLGADRLLAELLPSTRPADRGIGLGQSLGIAAVALLVMSGQPWFRWASSKAPLLQSDIRRVRAGVAIAGSTSPEAVIAVHAAGQIPYYSDRATIDLLGLNDPVIARAAPSGPFYPGHDKWNYDYSIRQLKPDLIADNWIRLGDYMKGSSEYRELDNGMYVRRDTQQVDVPALLQAFP
jgi:hypothetical protein